MFGYGLMWQMCLNRRFGILAEVGRENATFGKTKFTSDFLIGVGADCAVWYPTRWMAVCINLQGNLGRDSWHCNDLRLNGTESAMCYGLSGGLQLDFVPKKFLDIVVRAQQYMLFSGVENYAKPAFSLGLKYVWNN